MSNKFLLEYGHEPYKLSKQDINQINQDVQHFTI